MNDDDDLKPYDLSAWDAPPPPANLADRVLARMTAADEAMARAREHQPRRRWQLAGGLAAALVAVSLGVWLGVRGPHGPADATSGAVVADKPRALELGASSASLDAGADVRWRREGNVLHVEQRAGAATWKVGGTDQLVIDAGAAVASVEARNANVRVEVQMNMSDMRVVAGSAATAAAVALVTAVVYEGYVRIGGSHQTVVVQPGTRVEVRPGQPPHEVPAPAPMPPQPLPPVPANGAELVVQAGESATIHVPTNDSFETQAVVQIQAPCKTSMDLRIETPTKVAEDVATLAIGRHPYEIRCDGAAAPAFTGVIELVADAGTGDVMDRAPRKGISLDGRTYTLSVQGAFPVIDLVLAATASHYRLDLERDGAPYMTLEGADTVFSLEPTALRFGTYLIRTSLDGKLGSTTKLVIQADPHARVASIAEPVDGAAWSSPVRVAGVAIPSAQVSVSGIGVVVGDQQQHRFVAELDVGGASTLAIRVAHPQFGLHYFLRRRAVSVATAPSHGKQVVAILGLEPATSDRMLVQVAKDLSEMLRARAKAGTGPYLLAPASDKELVDEKLLNNCETEAPSCMAAVGASLGADVMMFGHIEVKADTYQVTLKLLDVRARALLRSVTAAMPRGAAGTEIAVLGKQLYTKLTGDGAPSSPPACDADALFDKGKEAEALGQHAVALQTFEAMLACKPDVRGLELAFMASCNLGNVGKARTYWQKLPVDARTRVAPICLRNHITQDALDGAASCDADKLREEGTQDEGLGQHVAALKAFEASFACKADVHTTELALLASCNAGLVAKARTFWTQLPPARRLKLLPLCKRNGITRDQLDTAATGTLVLQSNPAAKVLIDGKDTGQTTPIKGMALAPGVYKVVLIAGSEKRAFEVTIEAGKATTVAKDLGTELSPPSCDAEELRQKGVEASGLGQHAHALALFKQSLRCKPDAQTLQLAFMASCNASDVASARTFWKRLSPSSQNRLYQLCARNHILREQLDGP